MKKDQLNQNLVDYISMSSKVVTIIIVIHPKKKIFQKIDWWGKKNNIKS